MRPFVYRGAHAGVDLLTGDWKNLSQGQLRMLVNGTVRTGWPETRPGFVWRDIGDNRESDRIRNGLIQGCVYVPDSTRPYYIIATDGYLVGFDPSEIEPRKSIFAIGGSRFFGKSSPRVYFQEHAGGIVAQDGTRSPVIIEARDARTASETEVPVGKMMASGWFRLAVAVDRKIYVSNHEFDETNETPFEFTEGNEGSLLNPTYFEVPASAGSITGMEFLPQRGNPKGTGPLFVFCENGTFAYNISGPRETWAANASTVETTLPSIGGAGPVTSAQGDLYFTDSTGHIRRLQQAVSDEGTLTYDELDYHVWPLTEKDSPWLRPFRTHVLHNRRVLTTINPQHYELKDGRRGVFHSAILTQELWLPKPLQGRDFTVWGGIWTGIRPITMSSSVQRGASFGEETCLIVSRDADETNQIYLLSVDRKTDSSRYGEKEIEMRVRYPEVDPFESPFSKKKVLNAHLRVEEVQSSVSVQGFWLSDRREQAIPWHSHKEDSESCLNFDCDNIQSSSPRVIPRITFGPPSDKECDKSTGASLSKFYIGQPEFVVTGHSSLREIQIDFEEVESDNTVNAKECGKERSPNYESPLSEKWLSYDITTRST